MVGRGGFEPPKVRTTRFTVWPIWPLWNLPLYAKIVRELPRARAVLPGPARGLTSVAHAREQAPPATFAASNIHCDERPLPAEPPAG